MKQDEIVTEIGKQAVAVARQRESYDKAFVKDRMARAELLEAVVGVVTPALRAIGSRVAAGGKMTKEGSTTIPASFRAIQIWGDPGFKDTFDRDHKDAQAIYLTDRGDLVVANYHGEWQHERTTWCWSVDFDLITSLKAIELAGGSPNATEDRIMLDRIALALEREAKGSAVTKTHWLTERADRVRAAATLLRAS